MKHRMFHIHVNIRGISRDQYDDINSLIKCLLQTLKDEYNVDYISLITTISIIFIVVGSPTLRSHLHQHLIKSNYYNRIHIS